MFLDVSKLFDLTIMNNFDHQPGLLFPVLIQLRVNFSTNNVDLYCL